MIYLNISFCFRTKFKSVWFKNQHNFEEFKGDENQFLQVQNDVRLVLPEQRALFAPRKAISRKRRTTRADKAHYLWRGLYV